MNLNIKTGFWLSFLLLFIGAIFTFFLGYNLLFSHAKQDINKNFFSTSLLVSYNIDSLFNLVSNSVKSFGNEYTHLYETLPLIPDLDKQYWETHYQVEEAKAIHFKSYPTQIEPSYQDPYAGYLLFNKDDFNDEVFKHLNVFKHIHSALKNTHETIDFSWTYFTTANDMMVVYPYLPYDFIDEAYKPTQKHFYLAADFENRQVGWEEPHMDLSGEGMIITASYPVYSQQQLLGVASQDITLDQLTTDLLDKLNLYEGTLSFMMDKNGKAIANNITEYLQEIDIVNEKHYQAVLHYRSNAGLAKMHKPDAQHSNYSFLNQVAENVIQHSESDVINFKYFIAGEAHQVFATQTEIAGWYIVSIIPENIIYKSLKTSMFLMASLIVSIIALSYLMTARFLFNNIINPIEQLSYTATQARDGNLNIRSDVKQNNEIGELAEIFNQMLDNLRNSLGEIESHNQELEQRIQRRTLQLEQNNKALTVLNQEKNEFLAIAAHDLKNPLQAIQGSAELIELTIQSEQFDNKIEVVEFANMINISAERMFELITNLLDVNAIEAGKIIAALQHADILPTLQCVVDEYVRKAQMKEITVDFRPEMSHYMAYTDIKVLYQILDNLLSNAIKYSPFYRQVYIRIFEQAEYIRVEVQDEGHGLSIEDQNKLFGKFTRLSAKPTNGEHSTGLGLFIVRKLITTLNGSVWCESKLGQGATFIILIPQHIF
ncbi:ATP-binding protein [Candidatus Albibeggiatoa sp. nov. BB20]|uniref:ATP-binding protein n=1 Tax=Candidatus Albibeggiatoa sp. nov. BB20 TaxID=3162723 RepID=UPI003365A7CA